MAQDLRLDLLLKEIEDKYVQENFRKLKRYLDCLDSRIGEGSPSTPSGGNTIVIGGGSNTAFYNTEIVADSAFLISRQVTLTVAPSNSSESVYLNGLVLSASCYTISGTVLTLDSGLDLEELDDIFVKYAANI